MENKLPIPGRPRNILPPGQGPNGKYTKADIPKLKEVLNEVQKQLEKLRIATKGLYVPAEDQLVRVIDELQNGIALLENNQAISSNPNSFNVANNPQGPSVSYKTGNVSAGSNVGSGTVNNENVVGRDHIEAENYYKVDKLYVGEGFNNKPTLDLKRTYLARLMVTSSRIALGQLVAQLTTRQQNIPEINLDSVYIPLDSVRTQSAVRLKDEPEKRVNAPLLESVNLLNRMVLLGDPGSGKTTFTNFLTLCLAGAQLYPDESYLTRLDVPRTGNQRAGTWRYGALLPVRVELREFVRDIPDRATKGTTKLLWDHITKCLTDSNLADFGNCVEEALQAGSCMVMFDGLDEVADKKQRRIVREAIVDFADTYDKNRYIVTCRVLSYTDPEWQLPEFSAVTLAPLSEQAIYTFIVNWYNTLADASQITCEEARNKSNALWTAISGLKDLAANPMLLTVMAVVHTYKGELPRERARLYNDCINLLLRDWQLNRHTSMGEIKPSILEELDTREHQLVNGLCEVAFEAHKSQGGQLSAVQIPEKDVMGILKGYFKDWSKAERFCDYVEERAGLLVGKGEPEHSDRVYAFAHRGFQEFLAARHLVAGWEFSRQIIDLLNHSELWYEVVMLAVGHMVYNQQETKRALDAIDRLCPADKTAQGEKDWRAIWWAGEMLQMVGRLAAEQDDFIGKDVTPRVIKRLVTLVQGGYLSPQERAKAADVLGLLGDPRPGIIDPRLNPDRDMVLLQNGLFEVGGEDAKQRVRLKPFYMARYPVTNAQFRSFLLHGYDKDKYWLPRGLQWRDKAHERAGYLDDPHWGIDNRPVNGVTWYEAQAYVRWLADKYKKPFRLPTEIEWERAAAGQQRRLYPWGNRASGHTSNIRETGIGTTTAVGIFPSDRTPEGIYDLGGNVWEWTLNLDKGLPYKAGDGRANPDAPGARILRGGSYDSPKRLIQCSQRHGVEPHARVPLIGFRVVMDVE